MAQFVSVMLGLTIFGLFSSVDARNYTFGYRPSQRDLGHIGVLELTTEMRLQAPDKVDWHEQGALTPIKDQGHCGSCWSFSTIQTVESAVFMATGQAPPVLSQQQLVDCDNWDGTPRGLDQGCLGGTPVDALTWLEEVGGVTDEADYPYCGACGDSFNYECSWSGRKVAKVTSHKYAVPRCGNYQTDCDGQDEEGLAAALAAYGPISIAVHSDTSWIKYTGGVLGPKLTCESGTDRQNHAVQLVGYDKSASPPYWKIRNSYGEDFGEGGFIRVPMGVNACGLANEAVVVTAEPIDSASAVFA